MRDRHAEVAFRKQGIREDGLPMPRRTWAIFAISFGMAVLVVDGNIANVALPTIARELGVADGVVTNVVTVYQLVLVMLLLPLSTLGDQIGHRTMYQLGQAVFLLASGMAFFVDSFIQLLVLRTFQAIGAGMAMSVGAAMLRNIYPARSLGSGLGLNSVVVAGSAAIAPTLGGFIVAQLDWRWIFFAAVPFAVLSMLLGRALPEPVPQVRKFDWRGALLSAVVLALLVGGLQILTHSHPILGSFAIASAMLIAIYSVQRSGKQEHPIIPVDLLAKPTLGLSVLAAMLAFAATSILLVSLPFKLEQGLGYEPVMVGLLILPFPLTMLFVAPVAGWLSDHISPSILGCMGLLIAIVGFAFIAFLPANAGEWAIVWRFSLSALGLALFFAPNSRLLIGSAPRERSAAAGGLLSTSRLLGQAFGASIAGVVLATQFGLGPLPAMVAAVFALVAAIASAIRFRAGGSNLIRRKD